MQLRSGLVLFLLLVFWQLSHAFPVLAAQTFDMADPSNWNIRIDGISTYNICSLGQRSIQATDLNNDGKVDLVIGCADAGYNGRHASGSIYIIFNSLLQTLSGKGGIMNLSDPKNYNIRFDGPIADTHIGQGEVEAGNILGTGKNDIIFGAQMSFGTISYSTYIISNSLIKLNSS
ncbi:MAG: FG-GAP repeat protein [Patescibacteria group bacterium]|nr:FG-GAP repeat protein [Patescibacteria group bacterium]MCL5431652.1 FG-GAP repeat protein [Patescibacteria group bacterium]